jgi:hypothetical protein
MSQEPARHGFPAHLIWSSTKFLNGSLRSVRNPLCGRVECALYDVFNSAGLAPQFWHALGRRLRRDGHHVRVEGVEGRIELLTSHAAVRHLLDTYTSPCAERRTAYAQLRKAERAVRNGF